MNFNDVFDTTKSKKVKQIGALYSSMILGLLIGIGISVVNTRLLGPEQYGDLKFLQSLFTFMVTFLTLGLFVSGGRVLAQKRNEEIKHQLIGVLLIVAAIISIILMTGLFIFSFFEDQIFQNQLGGVIRIFSPFLFVFPFQICFEKIMQGDNRIYELSIFRIGPRILYLLGAVSFNYFVPLSLVSSLAIQFIMLSFVILFFTALFKPQIYNVKSNLIYIWNVNKTHGFHVYLGMISGIATGHLAAISIGYLIDNINVGYFSLALTVTMPLVLIPSAVGTTFYKDFANINSIPCKATLATLLLSIIALFVFLLIIKDVILLLYDAEFEAVIPLAYLVSIGSILHGFGDYLNRFIGSHGMGKYTRNGAIMVGLSNIVGYTFFIALFGVTGAAVTRIFSGMIYFLAMLFYYKKLTGLLKLNSVSEDQ